jgi:hypothetical protein
VHGGERVDVEAVARADLAQLGFHLCAVRGKFEAAFAAQHDVVEHGHVLDQHEVLVDHADAQRDGVMAGADAAFLAVDQQLAAVGFVIAVQDAHQGGFAGAIFTDHTVDRAAVDGEADVGVRLHGPEGLADVAKFYGWLHGWMAFRCSRNQKKTFKSAPNRDQPARRASGGSNVLAGVGQAGQLPAAR